MTTVINQTVTVNAFYFSGRDMKTFPRAIEYGGRQVTFSNGLRCLVRRGTRAINFFDMNTPGSDTTYRLRQDEHGWTLLGLQEVYSL